MPLGRILVSAFLSVSLISACSARQATSSQASSTQATTLLQNSLNALSGTQTLSDVTLSGTVRHIAGSTDESGNATAKAILAGDARLDMSLSSGTSTEIDDTAGGTLAGSWSGADSVSHPIAQHNLFVSPSWFFPAFPIAAVLSGSNLIGTGYSVTYVGQETLNGQSVQHVTISQPAASQEPDGVPALAHLTQVDLYLDSTTSLPAAMNFYVHPDNNAAMDIPIRVLFSDYRNVNGAQVPFHVQRFIGTSELTLDLQFTSATLNTGLTTDAFQLQ